MVLDSRPLPLYDCRLTGASIQVFGMHRYAVAEFRVSPPSAPLFATMVDPYFDSLKDADAVVPRF
ncbi:hypothetical protein L195_g016027 [Trifolium pratense]|uniref:Uncharacterized protein n=1 Tax=Trifolium pratense TaxID=57577 RepID=A0A2K3MQ79_TRIPR|nr:hypothetical protein L195_g016027 [Trifolium pratense]